MFKKETKATLMILLIVAVIIILISILLYVISNKKDNNNYFPNYNNIDIKDSDLNNNSSDSYKALKSQLESDPYFAREAVINNYYYKSYTSADLQNMLWNFIFSYEIKNTKYLSYINKEKGSFCMRTRRVVEAFNELYGVNINKDIEILEGYFQYVSKNSNSYCFDYANVSYEYNNNEIYVAVDGIQSENGIITANIYLYEFYIMNTDTELANLNILKNAISVSNYSYANSVVTDFFNGKVTRKQLEFKINNNGDYFKYQILSSKLIDY